MGTGRPQKYATPEELEKKVVEYISRGEDVIMGYNNKTGEPIVQNVLTITGLTLHLGYVSRQSLLDVARLSPGFSDVIRRAKLAVSHSYEKLLTGGSRTASFALSNIDKWQMKTSVETISSEQLSKMATIAAKYIPDESKADFQAEVSELIDRVE